MRQEHVNGPCERILTWDSILKLSKLTECYYLVFSSENLLTENEQNLL